jgi:hypothetical protein
VSDRRHFIGMVALLNSLRLAGHDEPFFVVDAGLTADQRDVLADHVRLIRAPQEEPVMFLPPLGPMTHPAEVAILLDADVIVLRPLTDLMETAREGRIVAFVNNPPNHDRFFPEWSATFGLGALRRQPYINAGHVMVPQSLGRRLLPLWREGQTKLDLALTLYGRARLSDPFYFADQDVLNAILAAHFEPDELRTLENRLAAMTPFDGLRLIDRERLVCRYADGTQPFLLHHILEKPWLKPTRSNVYSLLLPRLLLAPDVELRLEPRQLPPRLRDGWLARADRTRANAQVTVSAETRKWLRKLGISSWLAAGRRRLAGRGSHSTAS